MTPSNSQKTKIKFGTDGWRGVIGGDFTFANLRRVAQAIAHYAREESQASSRGLVIGYDTRFLSPESACLAAETCADAGLPVFLADRPTPTPAVSFAVVDRKTAGGIMITASHNPYRWNGVKFKAPYGGSAALSIMRRIEKHLGVVDQAAARSLKRQGGSVQTVDLVTPYLEKIKTKVSLERIRSSGLRLAVDPMYGAARGSIARLFDEADIPYREIHGEHNPLFPGLNPEPIEPHVAELRDAVVSGGYSGGLATDGDADRVGAIDRTGSFVDSHKIFAILLKHLVEDLGMRGEVVRTFSTTQMIDKIARKHRLPLHVTPIGFKYICELMLTRDVLIGGEESGGIGVKGHLPERDGILNSLLLAEVMAEKGKTLGELIDELSAEFGPHFYQRVDLELERPAIERLMKKVAAGKIKSVAGRKVTGLDKLDGVKLLFGHSAWLLVRPSGTENLLRLYAEAPSPDQVAALLHEIGDRAREEL
ncbi:MAG: phosphoglucomutase/phosphomannomutase family protein [Terriglobia bacterium]